MQESLQAALEQYEGTILLISHNRYLIDQLATQIGRSRRGDCRFILAATLTLFVDERLEG